MTSNGSRKVKIFMFLPILFALSFLFSSFTYAAPDELRNIHQAIKGKNRHWFAGETSVSKLPPHERAKRVGTITPQRVNEEELLSPPQLSAVGPQTTAPANLDYSLQYVTPVRDQGNCGSCWAFAASAALESQVLIAQNTPGVDLNLSEQVLVSCGNSGNCGGGYISSASNFIRDVGLPLENCYSYLATNGSCTNACPNWQNNTYQTTNWHWVTSYYPSLDALKNALYQYGPLVTTMQVYSDFFYYTGGIYAHTFGNYEGGHAVLIVGYDDVGQYFLVKNSWGTGWGEDGFFKIAFSELSSEVQFGYWTIAYEGIEIAPPPPAPGITVTSPNGGESWQAGTTQAIQWNYTGSPGSYVKLELLKGTLVNRIISSNTSTGSGNSGSYSWTVPSTQTPATDYKIRITSTTSSAYTDTSNNNFTITAAPAITVSSPNGGESWQAGTTQTIRWNYTGTPGSYVKIELLKGTLVNRIISSNTSTGSGGSGSYSWTISSTQAIGTDYKIRVTSTSSSACTDTSDNNSAINAPTPTTTIAVSSPNGGENWQVGTNQTIRWTYSGTPGNYVKIELLKGGVLNTTLSANIPIGAGGSGSYSWTIPSNQTAGTDYKVKITSTSNSVYTDMSDNNFTISSVPSGGTIKVTSPNGGENWQAGTLQTIRWTFTGNPGPYVRIDLLKGGVLTNTITPSALIGSGGSGSFTWTVPFSQVESKKYRIRITSTSSSAYWDSSDFTFTIYRY